VTPYYADDAVAIYHGDCREIDLDGDVLITDPPYGIGWTRGDNHRVLSPAHTGIANDEDTSVRDQVLKRFATKPAVVFGSFYAPAPERVRQVLVWQKSETAGVVGSTTGFRRDAEPVYLLDPWPVVAVRWSSVLRSRQGSNEAHRLTGHPHAKPLDLMSTLIQRSPVGVVLDPFMGCGSTLVAAKALGRRAVGVELDECYCEMAARRLSQEVLDFGGVA